MAHTPVVLALAGGPGSGKTTLAVELQQWLPGAAVVPEGRP
ncbi:zeta toxin family protein [Streptomyces camponoticapitis]|nr:zeta toxin family protein [Streptomyces camponoticapitis]